MKTTVQLLAGMCALFLVACGSDSTTTGSTEASLESFPAERGRCGPENKIDEDGDQKDLCDGAPATEICVKAGTMCFCATESETYQDCYVFDLESGDVTRIGSGRYCKGISHTEYTCGEPPKCPPDSNECMEDKECSEGYVCGDDGCCEPAPKCPPDSNECMEDKECSEGYVCGDDGCCEPAPKCPPDSNECMEDKECSEGYVCGDDGCCEPAPKCPPDSNECMEDKECSEGYVCGDDGCCEPAPPKCPPDQKECMDSKECASSEVCLKGCCVLAPK